MNLTPVADTTLFEQSPNNNLGASSLAVGGTFHAQRARALLRFDVASIPTNATIVGVRLGITIFKGPASTGEPSQFGLHRFLSAWTEGRGSGSLGLLAQAGESTWVSQFHGAVPWSSVGSAADVDYVSTASSSVGVIEISPGEEQPYFFGNTPELVADVQAWVSGTATNHGWIVICTGEDTPETARRIHSRETVPPILTIEYTVPVVEPKPGIASIAPSGGQIEIRFNVPSTYCYEVQARGSITSGEWMVLTNFCAPNADVQALATDTLGENQRFYRLRESGRVR